MSIFSIFLGTNVNRGNKTAQVEAYGSGDDDDDYEEREEFELDAEEAEPAYFIHQSENISNSNDSPVTQVAGSGLPWILELCLRNLGCQSVVVGGVTKCKKSVLIS